MSQILSQDEVDALLKGISGGEIETEAEVVDESISHPYDLTSQDKIVRDRMPTLEMLTEQFARMFRTTLSSLLRKVLSVNIISLKMMKYAEFMRTVPLPTSMHVFKMDPLKGNSLFVFESKIIFTRLTYSLADRDVIHSKLRGEISPRLKTDSYVRLF